VTRAHTWGRVPVQTPPPCGHGPCWRRRELT
jgi:hypothetical protein